MNENIIDTTTIGFFYLSVVCKAKTFLYVNVKFPVYLSQIMVAPAQVVVLLVLAKGLHRQTRFSLFAESPDVEQQ